MCTFQICNPVKVSTTVIWVCPQTLVTAKFKIYRVPFFRTILERFWFFFVLPLCCYLDIRKLLSMAEETQYTPSSDLYVWFVSPGQNNSILI